MIETWWFPVAALIVVVGVLVILSPLLSRVMASNAVRGAIIVLMGVYVVVAAVWAILNAPTGPDGPNDDCPGPPYAAC